MTGTIEVHARRWFQRTYGNTYHSVRVIVDGEVIGVRSDVYGYGRHYMHTAGIILIEAGHVDPGDKHPQAVAYDAVSIWLAEHLGKLVETCEDVPRKRDLLPAWWQEVTS